MAQTKSLKFEILGRKAAIVFFQLESGVAAGDKKATI